MIVGQDCLGQALIDATREVFETMMFMTVEECNELYEGIGGTALLGSITFQGKIEGCLGICCSLDAARTIAKNMMGMNTREDLCEEEIADALGEVANMVMGSIKHRVAASGADIQVSIPTVVSGTELHNSLGDDAWEISRMVSLDDAPARLILLYRESAGSKG